MNEASQLEELLRNKTKLVAMLAPSFPVVFSYPEIIFRLKALGFSYVVEVAVGAKETNKAVIALLQNNPNAKFITSPCASFVRLIKTKYPQFLKYLAFQADSPMVATAKIVKEKFPDYRPVFIGPCIVKKLESSQDRPELNILVMTYKEIEEVFKNFNIGDVQNANGTFDLSEKSTRLYPIDGGLTLTSGANRILKDEQFRIVSGWKNIDSALKEFEGDPKIRLLDVLFCEGGCINGPGINSPLTVTERKKKIVDYFNLNQIT